MDKEIAKYSKEAFLRLVFGFLPAGHVIDECINFRSNLKTNRILSFSNSLNDFLKNSKTDKLNNESFTNEEFIDVFDAIINKVQVTSSAMKLKSFENIILNQIIKSSTNEIISNKIIQTVDELNDIQLIILMMLLEQKTPSTINDIHINFKIKNVYINLNDDDTPSIDIKNEYSINYSIFLYFLDELLIMGLIEKIEIAGVENFKTQAIQQAYHFYIEKDKLLSNTKMVFKCSSYGRLVGNFIKTPINK